MKYGIDIYEAPNGATVTLYVTANQVIAWDPSGNVEMYIGTACSLDILEAERIAKEWEPKPETYTGYYTSFPDGMYRTTNHPELHFTLAVYAGNALILRDEGDVYPPRDVFTSVQWHRVKDAIKDCCPVLDA